MHVTPEAGVRLIQEPFLPLGAYIYPGDLSFRTAQIEKRSQMEAQDRAACASVVKEASPAQLKVLKAFAKGLRPQQVADQLHQTLRGLRWRRILRRSDADGTLTLATERGRGNAGQAQPPTHG